MSHCHTQYCKIVNESLSHTNNRCAQLLTSLDDDGEAAVRQQPLRRVVRRPLVVTERLQLQPQTLEVATVDGVHRLNRVVFGREMRVREGSPASGNDSSTFCTSACTHVLYMNIQSCITCK